MPEGSHSLVVYASDTAGNMGKSGTAYFTVSLPTASPSPSIPEFPSWMVLPFDVGVLALVIMLRRQMKNR